MTDYSNFPIIPDGSFDSSAGFAQLMEVLYASSVNASPRTGVLKVRIPPGQTLLTVPGVLSAAFTSLTEGVHFVGDGIGTSELIYDNSSTADDNHLLDSAKLRHVSFENLTLTIRQPTSKVIKWRNNGGGSGSWFSAKQIRINGYYSRFFDVQGTILGSETYWENVSHNVPAGGTFFYVASTNVQSINHVFINCVVSAYSGGGTIFEFNAGGNLKVIGGYCSLSDGATFLKTRGSGSQIGTNTKDFTIIGWHPEEISGQNGGYKLLDIQAGNVTFQRCNLAQLTNSGANVNVLVAPAAQLTTSVTFEDCMIGAGLRISVANGCDLSFNYCEMPDWNTVVASYTRGEATNFYSPRIRVTNRKNGPDADPFFFERDAGAAQNLPPMYGSSNRTAPLKSMLYRSGTTGNSNGITGQNGGVYGAANEITVPLGSVITGIEVVYKAGHASIPTSSRKLKLENHNASITWSTKALATDGAGDYAAEQTFNGNVAGIYRTPDLWQKAYTSDDQKVLVYLNRATGSGTLADFGYVVVHYY